MTGKLKVPDLTPAQARAVVSALAFLDAEDDRDLAMHRVRRDVLSRTLRIFQDLDVPPVGIDTAPWEAVQVAVEELRSAVGPDVTGMVLVVNGDYSYLMPVWDRPDIIPEFRDEAPYLDVTVDPVYRPSGYLVIATVEVDPDVTP